MSRYIIGGSIVLTILLIGLVVFHPMPPKVHPPEVSMALLKPHAPFIELRRVDVMGVVVLRHQPTAQRVVIMSSSGSQSPASLDIFFSQPLSSWTLQLMLNLLKSHSKFEHSQIEVEQSTLFQSGQKTQSGFQVSFKRYWVKAQVDHKSLQYEAYFAKVQKLPAAPMLVLLFNTRNKLAQSAFDDLLLSLNP